MRNGSPTCPQSLGVEPPYALMISLTGIKGVRMNVGIKAQWHEDDDICTLDRDQFHFGEVIIETVPNSVQECAVMIRPFIEQLRMSASAAIRARLCTRRLASASPSTRRLSRRSPLVTPKPKSAEGEGGRRCLATRWLDITSQADNLDQ